MADSEGVEARQMDGGLGTVWRGREIKPDAQAQLPDGMATVAATQPAPETKQHPRELVGVLSMARVCADAATAEDTRCAALCRHPVVVLP